MIDDELPWPTPGDELFGTKGPPWHIACLGWSHEQWYGYTEGYRRAREFLTAQALESRPDLDTLVYPIVFCARHYLEIKLKYLSLAASRLLDRDCRIENKHSLLRIWRLVRPVLEEIFPEHGHGELEIVQKVLAEFESRDSTSMVFRYPENTDGQSHQPSQAFVNLQTFHRTMQRVTSFLEACD